MLCVRSFRSLRMTPTVPLSWIATTDRAKSGVMLSKPLGQIARSCQTATATPTVPEYLISTYWWAYVSPKAIRFFERPWLANLILWGNYRRLGDAALAALGAQLEGSTLQIACVYGDLTPRIAAALPSGASLTVVDVVQGQLDNLRRKLPSAQKGRSLQLQLANSASLPFASACFSRALLFFLLHEMPEDVRRATLSEALRVLRPGGRLVIVDYHKPAPWHPLRLPMAGVLKTLEPFAMDLWNHRLETWLPQAKPQAAAQLQSDHDAAGAVASTTADACPRPSGDGTSGVRVVERRTVFGGLYQIVVFEKQPEEHGPSAATAIPPSAACGTAGASA